MRYEKELLELIPMLKNYLKKISQFYNGLIDEQDALQECLLNALQVSDEKYIRQPRNYFIGVFDSTIKSMGKMELKERKAREKYKRSYTNPEYKIIPIIDTEVKKESKRTQDIWFSFKQFEGDLRKTQDFTGISYQAVHYHKRKLRKIYKRIIEV